MSSKTVLVTGATGFIGRPLCARMLADGLQVREAVGDIGPDTDWTETLEGVDIIVHLAARVHVMKETANDPCAAFRRVNVLGTERLAHMAAAAEVQRMVYISSVGVHGQSTQERPFTEQDTPSPHDSYSVSKWEAEQVLRRVSKNHGLEIVVLRPPLVYGPLAPGNFGRLIRLVKGNFPLPLGSVRNVRSFIYVGNLVDAIVACTNHPKAAGETFLVSDGHDISTAEFIRAIALAMEVSPRLFPCPPRLLWALGGLIGKADEVKKLINSLSVDISKIRTLLEWCPPFTIEAGLKETVERVTGD